VKRFNEKEMKEKDGKMRRALGFLKKCDQVKRHGCFCYPDNQP
jgi:hypothetical protein